MVGELEDLLAATEAEDGRHADGVDEVCGDAGVVLVAIPKYTKGALALAAKKRDGQPLTSKVEALETLRENSGYLLAPPGRMDHSSRPIRIMTAIKATARRFKRQV